MPADTAIIVGAGMAGLSAALSLAEKGTRVHIIEQTGELSEVGAGLQISPNAARILDKLGVLQKLSGRWLEPESVTLASGRSLSDLTAIPLGDAGRRRWGATYGVLHRATLQRALIEQVEAHPNCQLQLGIRVDKPTAESLQDIAGEKSRLIIGADGVWSKVRSLVPGAGHAAFSGFVAWRFLVPLEAAPDFLPRDRVTAFAGPDAHVVVYPLKEAGALNLVAISSGTDPGPVWSIVPDESQRREFVDRAFRSWHPRLRELLLTAPRPTWWPLFGVSDGHWTDNRQITLIGDAAHAMLPFAAQGAVMAIEDGYDLAAVVSSMPVGAALVRYEALRRARVARVRARGDFNRFAYHARGPVRIARDLTFALRPRSSLAASLDWIYGYRAGEQDH